MVSPSVVAAMIEAGAQLFGEGFSAYGQSRANKQNYQIMKEQMDWQERMSSTAHQREVADLKAAGLNPVLSATGGSGASTGGASAATIQNKYRSFEQKLNAASVMSQIALNKEMKKTEETKQLLNQANSSKAVAEANNLFQYLEGIGELNKIKALNEAAYEKHEGIGSYTAALRVILKNVGSLIPRGSVSTFTKN